LGGGKPEGGPKEAPNKAQRFPSKEGIIRKGS